VKPVAVKAAPAVTKAKAVSAQVGKSASAAPRASTAPKSKPNQVAAGKPAVSGVKATPAVKPGAVAVNAAKPAIVSGPKSASQPHAVSAKAGSTVAKPAIVGVLAKPVKPEAVAVKPAPRVHAHVIHPKHAVAKVTGPKVAASVQEGKPAAGNKQADEKKQTSEESRIVKGRDPFISPVVAMGTAGSGCSAGKRCLTIDQIALKGIVKSEAGMIAVVTNAVDKAYFLRENDPVFNGYVVKITGDSIIFKETFRDRLGKTLTRDVTKSITRPVA
jgi:hypothetical protein